MCYKVADVLNSAREDHRDDEDADDSLITVQILSEYGEGEEEREGGRRIFFSFSVFELADSQNVIVRVYVTTIGAKIYTNNPIDEGERERERERERGYYETHLLASGVQAFSRAPPHD